MVAGPDRVSFLQGLVSNDIEPIAPGRAAWAALLTPQGKWLADFFVLADGDTLVLDAEQAQIPMLVQRLTRFRLRASVTVAPRPDLLVHAAWDGVPPAAALTPPAVAAPDPRLGEAGWRILSPTPLPTDSDDTDYDRHRLALGLPDGSRDLEADKTILLEAGFDELSGVSWTKGCYMGQELTARTKYRGLIKRRLVPVAIEGEAPAPGTPIFRDGADVGTMRSSRDGVGMAVLRVDAFSAPLTCGAARLSARPAAWMRVPTAG